MKVKALKDFRDKYTGELYKKGSTIEVTDERAAEMNTAPAAPLIAAVKEKKSKGG